MTEYGKGEERKNGREERNSERRRGEQQIPHRRSPEAGDRVRDDSYRQKGWQRQRRKRRQAKEMAKVKRGTADPSPPFARGGRPGSG
jgi:hypothetical protein